MKVRFNIEYGTVYGENLVLNIVDNANDEKVASHVMKPLNDKTWPGHQCHISMSCR